MQFKVRIELVKRRRAFVKEADKEKALADNDDNYISGAWYVILFNIARYFQYLSLGQRVQGTS